jgi:hypothetical protein
MVDVDLNYPNGSEDAAVPNVENDIFLSTDRCWSIGITFSSREFFPHRPRLFYPLTHHFPVSRHAADRITPRCDAFSIFRRGQETWCDAWNTKFRIRRLFRADRARARKVDRDSAHSHRHGNVTWAGETMHRHRGWAVRAKNRGTLGVHSAVEAAIYFQGRDTNGRGERTRWCLGGRRERSSTRWYAADEIFGRHREKTILHSDVADTALSTTRLVDWLLLLLMLLNPLVDFRWVSLRFRARVRRAGFGLATRNQGQGGGGGGGRGTGKQEEIVSCRNAE